MILNNEDTNVKVPRIYRYRKNAGDIATIFRLLITSIFIIFIQGSFLTAKADSDLSLLLNKLTELFSLSANSSTLAGCVGQATYCLNTTNCVDLCGLSYVCNEQKRCVGRIFAPCKRDDDCDKGDEGEHIVCNSISLKCSFKTDNSPCGASKDCLEGSTCEKGICIPQKTSEIGGKCELPYQCSAPATCDSTRGICREIRCDQGHSCPYSSPLCLNGRCEGCRRESDSCKKGVPHFECCDGARFECISGKCSGKDRGLKIGDPCPPEGCGGNLECWEGVCKGSLNSACQKDGDCSQDFKCLGGICKGCEKAANGKCLTPLGQSCTIHAECATDWCDEDTKVCVHKPVKCTEDKECLNKILVPDGEIFKPFCESEVCKLCVLSGNEVSEAGKCCNKAEPYEGKCLNSRGEDCKDPEECISGKCINGQCVADEGQPDSSNAKCGDQCCNGMETSLTCPADCPQRPTIPTGCVPNVGNGGPLTCETECASKNRCGGYSFVDGNSQSYIQCTCNWACKGNLVCFEKTCEDDAKVCQSLCITATGKISFSDGVRRIECSCGGVSGDASIDAIIVKENVCQSKKACIVASSVCSGGLRCCSSSNFSYPGGGGKCLDPSEVQPEDPNGSNITAG